MQMMILVTVMMMLVMATPAMWDLWDLWSLRHLWDLGDLWDRWGLRDLWDLQDLWDLGDLWNPLDLRDMWDLRPWGGVSQDGFAAVLWHPGSKKTNKEDWSQAVRDGKVTAALRVLNTKKKRGPWTILCDNEGFLRNKISMEAYRAKGIALWSVPPKSPDLNPVEMFWGWLRKKLRSMDLEDLRNKRRPLGKTAYTARVKGVLKSAKAQTVAKNVTGSFRKSCKQVVDRNGAAADN